MKILSIAAGDKGITFAIFLSALKTFKKSYSFQGTRRDGREAGKIVCSLIGVSKFSIY
jgi:hypothetical protein